jgi:hypothetical protein
MIYFPAKSVCFTPYNVPVNTHAGDVDTGKVLNPEDWRRLLPSGM